MSIDTGKGSANLVSFSQPEVQRDPFPFIAKLLAGERVYIDPVTRIPIVTRYADACDILGHPGKFSSKNPLIFDRTVSPVAEEVHRRLKERGFLPVDTLVTNDPPSHRRYRTLVDKVFSHQIVRALEGRMAEIADELIDATRGKTHIDWIREFALPMPLYVIADQLGVPRADCPRIKYWSDISIERISPVVPPQRELEITEGVIELQQYMWARAEDARRENAQSLLGLLVRAEIDGVGLNPEELMNVAMQIFTAGHETTTALIGHAARMLLDNSRLRARLTADMTLIPAFIEEALRLHPPVGQLRIATEDMEYAGTTIPKGTMLALCALSANRDPAQYNDPDQIDLSRKNATSHLTFGRGIHYCIGNQLARAEARIAVEKLLIRFPNMQMDLTKPRPAYAEVFHAHALAALPVTL